MIHRLYSSAQSVRIEATGGEAMDANATGRFIAKLRRQKGYTQKELAEKLLVTDKAVSRWETGVSQTKGY